MIILNTQEAAELLDVSEDVIRKLCCSGKLPAKKPGRSWRILQSSIEEYLKGAHDLHREAPQQEAKKWQSTRAVKRGISTSKATEREYANLLTPLTNRRH